MWVCRLRRRVVDSGLELSCRSVLSRILPTISSLVLREGSAREGLGGRRRLTLLSCAWDHGDASWDIRRIRVLLCNCFHAFSPCCTVD